MTRESTTRTASARQGVIARLAQYETAMKMIKEINLKWQPETFVKNVLDSEAKYEERISALSGLLSELHADLSNINSVKESNEIRIESLVAEISIWKKILAEWRASGASETATVLLKRMIMVKEAGLREFQWFQGEF